jgi:hypothetical protein
LPYQTNKPKLSRYNFIGKEGKKKKRKDMYYQGETSAIEYRRLTPRESWSDKPPIHSSFIQNFNVETTEKTPAC